MLTKTKKSLSALIALLLLLCITSIALAMPKQAPPPKAQEQGIGADRVVDEADILTVDEEKALDTKLAAVEQSHKVRILVGTMKDTGGATLGKVANNVVDQIATAENGTIVLLLSMKERDWYISTDNKMRTRITDGKGVDYLAGEFLPDLKEGKYAAAFTAFAKTTDEMLTYYEKEGKPYDPANAFNLMAFGIALACALILGGTIYYILYECGGNVTSATEADAYLNQDSFTLTQNEDNYLYTSISRQAKAKKESSDSNVSTSSRDSSHGGGGGKF